MRYLFGVVFCVTFLLVGCNQVGSAELEPDYEKTKKMVVDILKTDEGKKAVQDLMVDDEMKQQLIMNSDIVKESITKAFTSEESKKMWKRLFEDSDFVKAYTESLDEEQKKLFKGLMHDAAFQKQMLELLQNPEITTQMLAALKSQEFRAHLEETIEQTLDSPLYKKKIEEILLKASEKEQEKKKTENEE